MQHGEYVVEQVLDAQAEGFQVAPSGARQVGASPRAVTVVSDVVAGKPNGEQIGAAFDQMKRCHLSDDTGLRLRCAFPQMRSGG